MGLAIRKGALLQAIGPLVALLIAVVFFAVSAPHFWSGQNLSLILQQVLVVGVIAIGQTLVILTAGIDLSCGFVMAVSSIVMTKLAVDFDLNPYLSILIGLGSAMAFGALNGFLVTVIKLPPFIVTLGTMGIAQALTLIFSGASTVTNLPDPLTWLGDTFHIGSTAVTYGTVAMLVLYGIIFLYLRETAPGRHIYAVGASPEAARLTGIATGKVLVGVYILAGLFYGLAAVLLVARTGVGDPNAGDNENLGAITAVVLGGTSLFGGRGMILGSLVGAIIVGVFRNGLTLMGIPSIYQVLVTGILVILSVAAEQASRGKSR